MSQNKQDFLSNKAKPLLNNCTEHNYNSAVVKPWIVLVLQEAPWVKVISVFVNWKLGLRILFYEWWSFTLYTKDIKYISHSDWLISLLSVYYFQPVGAFQCRVSSFDYQGTRFLKEFIPIWLTKFQEVLCWDSVISWCQSSGPSFSWPFSKLYFPPLFTLLREHFQSYEISGDNVFSETGARSKFLKFPDPARDIGKHHI